MGLQKVSKIPAHAPYTPGDQLVKFQATPTSGTNDDYVFLTMCVSFLLQPEYLRHMILLAEELLTFGEVDCFDMCHIIIQYLIPSRPQRIGSDCEGDDQPVVPRKLALKSGAWLTEEHIRVIQEHTGHLWYDELRAYAQLRTY